MNNNLIINTICKIFQIQFKIKFKEIKTYNFQKIYCIKFNVIYLLNITILIFYGNNLY